MPQRLLFSIGKIVLFPSVLCSYIYIFSIFVSANFSHSCGYQKAFMEYSNILQQKYPEFRIHGEYYESNGLYTILAKLLVSITLKIII